MLLHIHHHQLGWYFTDTRLSGMTALCAADDVCEKNKNILKILISELSHWAFLVAIFCLLRHTDNKKSFLFPRITLCTSCTLQHVALTLLYPSLLSSSCNLTNIFLSFTDWMSNPFDRVVCGDFAGKKMQFKKCFVLSHFWRIIAP